MKANSCEPCLDLIPENHSLLKAKKLEEEGRQAFDAIMAYQSSQHISRFANVGLHALCQLFVNKLAAKMFIYT